MDVKTTFFKFAKRYFCFLICSLFSACTNSPNIPTKHRTTYQKYLAEALKGDVASQNLIGYMRYYGEGTTQDYEQAHDWFHASAEFGGVNAQKNLGLFHAKVSENIPNEYFSPEESNFWLSQAGSGVTEDTIFLGNYQTDRFHFQKGTPLESGEKVYQTFCAGCHGFDGIATYPPAPSFALGERLNKKDKELQASIHLGKELMPNWGNTLSKQLRDNVLFYIRNGLRQKAQQTTELTLKVTHSTSHTSPESRQQAIGGAIYGNFCAGCHGFNGIAYYINSPSFALGQRMNKGNAQLVDSIARGKGIMPSWEDKLETDQIDALVLYIRSLEKQFNHGIGRELTRPEGIFFRFEPLGGW